MHTETDRTGTANLMPTPVLNIHDVPQAIQLALGPVFLLTGIAGMLNVMTGRLARIIDRGRHLIERQDATVPMTGDAQWLEVSQLERRRHLASAAITACTLSALLICTVIAALFLEVILATPLQWVVGVMFTGATLSLVVGLAFFLAEVRLATRMIRIEAGAIAARRSERADDPRRGADG